MALLISYDSQSTSKIVLPKENIITNNYIQLVLMSSKEVIELPQYIGPYDQGGVSGINRGVWTSSIFVPLP